MQVPQSVLWNNFCAKRREFSIRKVRGVGLLVKCFRFCIPGESKTIILMRLDTMGVRFLGGRGRWAGAHKWQYKVPSKGLYG